MEAHALDESLEVILTEKWRSLEPNYIKDGAMLPQDLHEGDVIGIVKQIQDANPDKIFSEKSHSPDLAIGTTNGGLVLIGEGETKAVFRHVLKGKSILVILQRGFNLPAHVPSDPKIYQGFQKEEFSGLTRFSFYSDARTYLSVPILTGSPMELFGLHFQEDLGDKRLNDLFPVGLIRNVEERKVRSYVQSKGYEIVHRGDFQKREHYLFPNGNITEVAVLDILLKKEGL